MKRLMSGVLVLFLIGCADNPATRKVQIDSDNPFGFATTVHPANYEYCDEHERSGRMEYYICNSAPRPHIRLEGYDLLFMKEVGLCSITAYTRKSDDAGPSNIERFKDQISHKYGPAQIPDELMSKESVGKITKYVWFLNDGMPGTGDVSMIEIAVDADSPPSWVEIAFYLTNSETCLTEINEIEGRAF